MVKIGQFDSNFWNNDNAKLSTTTNKPVKMPFIEFPRSATVRPDPGFPEYKPDPLQERGVYGPLTRFINVEALPEMADVLFPPTPEQLAAREELGKKVSSTGISFADAEKTIKEIQEKYRASCTVTVESEHQNPEKYGLILETRFCISKLPEPVRTQYEEALAARNEIIENNEDLSQKAGLYKKEGYRGEDSGIPILGKPEKTEKQKAAEAQLNEKISSKGMSYKDAKATLSRITAKYKNNPQYTTKYENPNKPTSYPYTSSPTFEDVDPTKLPEPDKSTYMKALDAALEIEKKYSALAQQADVSTEDYRTRKVWTKPETFVNY